MDKGLDTGPILTQQARPLTLDSNFQQLHDELAIQGANMLVSTIANLTNITPQAQDDSLSCYAAKLTKEEGIIDWAADDIEMIDRKIRALNPWPGAFAEVDNMRLKLLSGHIKQIGHDHLPGVILAKEQAIAARGGILYPDKVQRPGKAVITMAEFLRGI